MSSEKGTDPQRKASNVQKIHASCCIAPTS
jgi:hypothetical protein